MEAAHGGGGCPAVPRTRRAATAAPPARSAPASPGTSTPPDPPGRRAACPRSAAVAATPGCRSPTPPAAPGSACCSRSGAYRRNCTDVCQPRQRLRGAHLNAPDCQPTSASQCPRHAATRRRPRPANCLNPRQWCSRMRSSERIRHARGVLYSTAREKSPCVSLHRLSQPVAFSVQWSCAPRLHRQSRSDRDRWCSIARQVGGNHGAAGWP